MNQFLFLIFVHWVADFVCQTAWMVNNKSKAPNPMAPLATHCFVYALAMSAASFHITGLLCYPFLIFFISHFFIDAITSKITHKLWDMKNVRWFFNTIGFDQVLHYGVIYLVLQGLV